MVWFTHVDNPELAAVWSKEEIALSPYNLYNI